MLEDEFTNGVLDQTNLQKTQMLQNYGTPVRHANCKMLNVNC